MEFCPNCGGVLTSSRQSGRAAMICRKCGYTKKMSGDYVIISKSSRRQKASVTVLEDEETEIHPKTTDVQCPSCGNREAYWWSVQTRSADEPMTQFFRCTRCGHTWREYA